jgi:hypothetical protein
MTLSEKCERYIKLSKFYLKFKGKDKAEAGIGNLTNKFVKKYKMEVYYTFIDGLGCERAPITAWEFWLLFLG